MDAILRQRLKRLISPEIALSLVVDELRQMKNDGFEQEVVRTALEDLRITCNTELEEDRILEVLDFVTGFCPPEMKVWDY